MLYIFAIRLTLEGNKKGYTLDIVQNNKLIHGNIRLGDIDYKQDLGNLLIIFGNEIKIHDGYKFYNQNAAISHLTRKAFFVRYKACATLNTILCMHVEVQLCAYIYTLTIQRFNYRW